MRKIIVLIFFMAINFYAGTSFGREKKIDCSQLKPRANLVGCDFSGRILKLVDLQNADLREAKFNNAELSHVNFKGAHLEKAKFNDIADASYVDFAGADLTGAEVRGSRFSWSRFDLADLTNINLEPSENGAQTRLCDYCTFFMTITKGAKVAGACLPSEFLENGDYEGIPLRCGLNC